MAGLSGLPLATADGASKAAPPSIEDVVASVAQAEGIPARSVAKAKRQLAEQRGIAMYLAQTYAHASPAELSRYFQMDHSTVAYWCSKVKTSVVQETGALATRVERSLAVLREGFDVNISRAPVSIGQRFEGAPGPALRVPVETIVAVVADSQGLPVSQVMSPTRSEGKFARGLAIYLTRKLNTVSYKTAVRAFGLKDHTTGKYWYDHFETAAVSLPVDAEALREVTRRIETIAVGLEAAPTSLTRDRPSRALQGIAAIVARSQGLPLHELFAAQDADARTARAVTMYLANRIDGTTPTSLSRQFGFVDPTTVSYWCERVGHAVVQNPQDAAGIEQLADRVMEMRAGLVAAPPSLSEREATPPTVLSIGRTPETAAGTPAPVPQGPVRVLAPRQAALAATTRAEPWNVAVQRIAEVLRADAVMVTLKHDRIALGDLLESPRGRELVEALRDIYLVDRLPAIDARRAGLEADRNAAIARMESQNQQQRKLYSGLRMAIAPRRDAVMMHVGRAVSHERAHRIEQKAPSLAFALG